MARGIALVSLVVAAVGMPATAAAGDLDAPPEVLWAPQWQIGDWWDIWYEDASPGAEVHRARATVVAMDDEAYSVALDTATPDPGILIAGLPGMGRVLRDDLSSPDREDLFQPLRFPLVGGASWQTTFADRPVRAEVVSVDGAEAVIHYLDRATGELRFEAVYDGTIGWLRAVHVPFMIRAEVEDHGTGGDCHGFLPTQRRILFSDRLDDAAAAVVGFPPGHVGVHNVEGAAGLASVALSIVGGNGWSEVEVVAPAGDRFAVTVDPVDDIRSRTVYGSVLQAEGPWTVGLARTSGLGSVRALAVHHVLVPVSVDCPAAPMAAAASSQAAGPVVPSPVSAASLAFGAAAVLVVGRLLVAACTALAPALRRSAPSAPLVGLFSRVDKGSAPTHPRRAFILDLLAGRPGLTTQELRHAVGAGWNTTVHHLRQLERTGLVVSTRLGRNRHWYRPQDAPNVETRRALALLRRPRARAVYDAVRAEPGLNQNEIARLLGVHHTTVLYHARRLVGVGHLEARRVGGAVRYYVRKPAAPA